MVKPYTKSVVGGIVGGKGAGKSVLLAYEIILKLIEGETVWSNMPVKTSPRVLARKYSPGGRKIEYAETKPLDWDLLYKLDESMVEGTIAIDEIGYFDGARQSMSTRNRLINGAIRQVRHRNLDFIYTARRFGRVDYYLRDETDWVAKCEDLTYSPWGQKNKLPGGVMINVKYFDISGMITGNSVENSQFAKHWEDSGFGCYKEVNLDGRLSWDCYDTRRIISLEEVFTGIELDFKKRRIGNKEEKGNEIYEKVLKGISNFIHAGQRLVSPYTFWTYMKETFGLNGTSNSLARYLPNGVKRFSTNHGRMYDFSEVAINY